MFLFNNIQEEIISQIRNSKSSIKIAVTWFTNHDIFSEIIAKLRNANYEAALIVLNDGINNKTEGLDFQQFIDCNGSFYYSETDRMIHHKFCVIDNSKVITGSYNWTYYAEKRNRENVVIFNDSLLVKGYTTEFDEIVTQYKRISNVQNVAKKALEYNSNKVLQTDYYYQAQNEESKGNNFAVAKIYTQLLYIDKNQTSIADARTKLLQKINSERFELCPFEIGIQHKNSYTVAIEACQQLPFTTQTWRDTSSSNSQSHFLMIKRTYGKSHAELKLPIYHSGSQPLDTPIIEYYLSLDKNGILHIYYKELKENNIMLNKSIDIRNWM